MHKAAPTTATPKDHSNPADNKTVMFTPDTKGIDKVLVVEPIKGILRLNTVWQINTVATNPTTKNTTINNGFL